MVTNCYLGFFSRPDLHSVAIKLCSDWLIINPSTICKPDPKKPNKKPTKSQLPGAAHPAVEPVTGHGHTILGPPSFQLWSSTSWKQLLPPNLTPCMLVVFILSIWVGCAPGVRTSRVSRCSAQIYVPTVSHVPVSPTHPPFTRSQSLQHGS